jgi:type II secretion system protein J
MTRRRSPSGFTLLELLIAMSIMVMLTASLYAAMSAAFRGRRTAEEALEPARRAGAALAMIEDDLESACAPVGILAGEFLEVDGRGDSGQPADSMLFHAVTDEPAARTPPAPIVRIEYALATDAESGDLVLVRRTTTNLLSPETPTPVEEVLCRHVRSFDLSCYDGLDWQAAWDSTTLGNVLPLAVTITLVIATDTESDYTLSRTIALPCATLPETATPGATSRGGTT